MGVQVQVPGYYSILTYGSKGTEALLDGDVTVTEKVDGSQFRFGLRDGEFYMASHHKPIYEGEDYGMFDRAVEGALGARFAVDKLAQHWHTKNLWFFVEYLQRPKQNTLAYERMPDNHLCLWGVFRDGEMGPYGAVQDAAATLEIEAVPLLARGRVSSEDLVRLLDTESFLGAQKVEGLVITNAAQTIAIGPRVQPLICKLVRIEFKEQHKTQEAAGKSAIQQHMETYCSEARWLKAIQRRREASELLDAPQDIGPLLKSISQDLGAEEAENIKEFLWRHYRKEYLRTATRGFAYWYKERLAEGGERCKESHDETT
jgi:hypothetical protein